MRRNTFLMGLLAVVAAVFLSIPESSYAAFSSTCEDLMIGNLYRCEVVTELGGEGEGCVEFVENGELFEGVVNDGDAMLDCTCKARHKLFSPPEFDAAKSFICSAQGGGGAVDGRAFWNGKILKGNGLFDSSSFGQAFVYKCVKDPSCGDD